MANLSTSNIGTLPVSGGGTGVITSTGTGDSVLSTSPTLVTPILGTPTSGDLQNCTLAIEGTKGVVPLASDAESVTGTSDAVVVTPGNLTARMEAPGAIGGTTPAAISGTTITGSGVLSVDDTTDSSSTVTGSIHTDGGLGVAKKSFFGDDADFGGNMQVDGIITAAGFTSYYGVSWNESTDSDSYTRRGTLIGQAVSASPGNAMLPSPFRQP